MPRFMCDSTNINDDPTSFQLVAYYCDGDFAVSEAAVRARFPHAVLVPISAIGTNSGVVGDCEPGCMTEDELVTWVVERRAANVDPTGYVNEMHGWVPARAAFARRGVREPHWWVADYDGLDVIPPGAVAKQDKNSAMTGGHFDKSVVADYWPGVDGAYGASAGVAGGSEITPELANILCRFARIIAKGSEPDAATLAADIASCPTDQDAVNHIVQLLGDGSAYIAKTAAVVAAGPAQADNDPTPIPGPEGPAGPQGATGPAGPPADTTAVGQSIVSKIIAALKAAFGL